MPQALWAKVVMNARTSHRTEAQALLLLLLPTPETQ
jgi:hypothetical protein